MNEVYELFIGLPHSVVRAHRSVYKHLCEDPMANAGNEASLLRSHTYRQARERGSRARDQGHPRHGLGWFGSRYQSRNEQQFQWRCFASTEL